MKATDEAALAVPVTTGDDGFEDLYALHEKHVSNIVYALLRYACVDPPDHAQDVKQDIWFKVKRSLDTFDSSRGEHRHWLSGIARNASIDHIRGCGTRTKSIEDAEAEGLLGETPVEEAESRIVSRIMLGELWVKLTDEEQTLAQLTYVDGLSSKEMAQRLGIGEGAVRQRQFRLVRKLQMLANQTELSRRRKRQ